MLRVEMLAFGAKTQRPEHQIKRKTTKHHIGERRSSTVRGDGILVLQFAVRFTKDASYRESPSSKTRSGGISEEE